MTEAPVLLLGVPIKEVRNPHVIAIADFQGDRVKYSFGFHELFKEATGFKCGNDEIELPRMPNVSAYVVLSEAYVRRAVKKCELPLEQDEVDDVLREIDEVLFDAPLIGAMRRAYRRRSAVIFREGEREVEIGLPVVKARFVAEHYLPDRIRYVDDSVVHLAGYLPIEFFDSKDWNLLKVNDLIWELVYGVKSPPRKDWILIWDNDRVTTIELVDVFKEAGAPGDHAIREG